MYWIIGFSNTSQNLRLILQEGSVLQAAISSNGFHYQDACYHGPWCNVVHMYAKNYPAVRKSYWQVVCESAASASTPNVGEGIFLQQDNAHPHRSQVCLAFLEKAMSWPAMSPNNNVIEKV